MSGFMGHVPEKFNYKLSSQTTKKIWISICVAKREKEEQTKYHDVFL